MRKKCNSCGLIGFTSDASCKRCGSNKLLLISVLYESPTKDSTNIPRSPSILNYLIYGFLAVVIEIAATSPIWGLIGAGPGGEMAGFLWLAFILNLPTILITWGLDKLTGSTFIILFTPITQIIFWFGLFAYFGNRRRIKMK